MNRVFTKKGRATDDNDRAATPQQKEQQEAMPSTSSKPFSFWGRKKQQPEPELDFSLDVVLPTTDDFRTSLIMPGLSARFSMLKDADDPFSKMGKASDDSVINRRSRHFATLGDISETSSIVSSQPIRPPFASQRTGSYHSDAGYATDDGDSTNSGSIMSRARPGEGNMLFGGRQKIYRIPIGDAGSVNNLGGGEPRGMRGRALYEDDVSMSAFQRLREKEKQEKREAIRLAAEQAQQDEQADSLCTDHSFTKRTSNSSVPSTLDEKRQTTSSINSGPSMTSASTITAGSVSTPSFANSPAPSLASPSTAVAPGRPSLDSAGRPGTKPQKRLYEQGLDQHIQEQQTANLTRLNSIARKTSSATRRPIQPLTASKSASSLRDRFERADAHGVSLKDLPSTEGLTTFESLRKASSPQPPASKGAANSESAAILNQALDSRDRGKATAMGTFNRPKQFDEAQFVQRQKSLMQSRANRSNSAVNGRPSLDRIGKQSSSAESSARPSLENRFRMNGRPQSPALEPRQRQPIGGAAARVRSDSAATAKSSTPTSPLATEHFDVSQEEDVSDDPETALENEVSFTSSNGLKEPPVLSPKPSFERGNKSDAPAPLRAAVAATTAQPPSLDEHPAMRGAKPPSNPTSPSNKVRRQGWAPGSATPNFATIEAIGKTSLEEASNTGAETSTTQPDVPTLRGIVGRHLRHASDESSIYPARESRYVPDDAPPFDLHIPSMYHTGNSNPWEMEDFSPYKIDLEAKENAPPLPTSITRSTMREPTSSVVSHVTTQTDSPVTQDNLDWSRELEKQHARAASSETQAERQAFADELAERKRAIHENLRVKAENGTSRSPSPGAAKANSGFESPFKLLRTRSSKDSLPKADSKTKRSALGKLGNDSSTSLERSNRDSDSMKPNLGRTLHSRLPRTDTESSAGLRDQSRRRQNSLASTRDTGSDSLHETPDQSSRTSTSRDDHSFDSQAKHTVTSPNEHPSQRNYGYFEARNPQNQYHQSPAELDEAHTSGFPFDRSGEIVEASRVRNNSVTNTTAVATTSHHRPPVPPLVTTTSLRSVSEPFSANSTPPLSTVSTPSLRDTNTSLSQLATAPTRSPDPSTFSPASFSFTSSSQDKPPRKPSRHRGPTITKADISEPQFISATSTVDTVALPAGASLSNGLSSDVDIVLAARHGASSPSDTVPRHDVTSPPPPSDGPGAISVTHMPPPTPAVASPSSASSGSGFRRGFFKFGRKQAEIDDEEDEFMKKPGQRLRIRKISNDELVAGKGRHRIVGAAEMEQSGFI